MTAAAPVGLWVETQRGTRGSSAAELQLIVDIEMECSVNTYYPVHNILVCIVHVAVVL